MIRPDISIIMSCHNEAEMLPYTIPAAIEQTQYVPDSELIVVVNGSTDGSLEIANGFANEHTKIIEVPTPGKKNAMNIGMFAAKSDVVLFLDADSFIPPDAALQALDALGSSNMYLVGASRQPLCDIEKLNIDFPTTFYALHYARRLARKKHTTVQGWFMALNKPAYGDDFKFPVGASADDVWLSAYTGTSYGTDKIGHLESVNGQYVAPDNMHDMTIQTIRHRSNHLVVRHEHPELSGFFDNLKKHYEVVPTEDEEWRAAAIGLGVDFDAWIDLYTEFIKKIDKDINEGSYVEQLLAMNGLWARVTSTKTMGAHRFIDHFSKVT